MIGHIYPAPDDYWVDTVAVERWCRGGRIGRDLSAAEQSLAVRVLLRMGHGVTDVALRLHISGTTASHLVREARAELEEAA